MKVATTSIPGVLVFKPSPFKDHRGMFSRTFDADAVSAAGIDPNGFVQDSMSRSVKGVVRAFHLRTGRVSQSSSDARPAEYSMSSSISAVVRRHSSPGSRST